MGESIFDLDGIIAAQATTKSEGLRGILRVSGSGALCQVEKFIDLSDIQINAKVPFIADTYFLIQNWKTTIPITLWFWPGEKGYTGQESLEIHLPGSPALIETVLHALYSTGNIRSARPGEFTLRAFLGGRFDLTQAEAVLGVIDAETDNNLEVALKQLSGNLSAPLWQLRDTLLETLAHLEAGFDFAEEDISFISTDELLSRIQSARHFINGKLKQIIDRTDHQILHRIILTGPSNSGKSSLFNRLIRRDHRNAEHETAIVSDIAGTTRDYLEKEIRLIDHNVLITDTAGLVVGNRPISDLSDFEPNREEFESKIGDLTRQAINSADLWYRCFDAELFIRNRLPLPPFRKNVFNVLTKVDVLEEKFRNLIPDRKDLFLTSSRSGEGINELCLASENFLFNENKGTEIVQGTVERCREAFQLSLGALKEAEDLILRNSDETLIAYELRNVLDGIGKILGVVYSDDILDSIFSRFCIGK